MAERGSSGEPGQHRVRRPVAVVVSRFPLITETFILREIIGLEQRGQPVVLVAMIREEQPVKHEEVASWLGRVVHAPFHSRPVAAAFLRAWFRKPALMFELLWWILTRAAHSPSALVKSLLLFPQSAWFAERLKEQGICHVHAHFATHPTTIAWIISALNGTTFSFTAHAHDIFVDRALLRRKIRRASFVRAISRFNKAFLENLYPAEAGTKISVTHVGVDLSRYSAADTSDSDREIPRILCIAAMKPYKGLSFLIEACRILVREGLRFRLDIIGSGPLRHRIEHQISAAGLQDSVHLLGALPQHQVAATVRGCDLFVLPSVVAADGQMEGIPVALMEAMAAEKPVIATSISGIPELVQDRVSGLLVDPANPRQLANALELLLSDSELRQRLGKAGREKIEHAFTLETSVQRLLEELDRHNPPVPASEILPIETILDTGRSYGLLRTSYGEDSAVHELIESNGRSERVIVKRHLSREGESRSPEIRSSDEYDLLRRLHEHFGGYSENSPSLRVPRPLVYEAGSAALAMTAAEGATLETVIRAARRGSPEADLAAAAESAGRWLAQFQRFEQGSGEQALGALRARALADLEATGSVLGRYRSRRVRADIETLADSVAAANAAAVSHHGDFWPGNIFINRSQAEVIDFEGYRLGLACEDIAYLLVHARLYLAYRAEGCMRVLHESFLQGYGEVESEQLRLCRIASALQMLARRRRGGNALHRLIQRQILIRELTS